MSGVLKILAFYINQMYRLISSEEPETWSFAFHFFEVGNETAEQLRKYSRSGEDINSGILLEGLPVKAKKEAAPKRKRKDQASCSVEETPTTTLYLRFDRDSWKFKHEDDAKIEETTKMKDINPDGRQKRGADGVPNESTVVATRFFYFVVSVDIPVKEMQYGECNKCWNQLSFNLQ